MKNLKYLMQSAHMDGESRHPQTVMREFGITYDKAIPQSIGDQWWFIDCKNIPYKLPSYLEYLEDFNPMEW